MSRENPDQYVGAYHDDFPFADENLGANRAGATSDQPGFRGVSDSPAKRNSVGGCSGDRALRHRSLHAACDDS